HAHLVQEISIYRQLTPHAAIVSFIDATENEDHFRSRLYIEYIQGQALCDLILQQQLPDQQYTSIVIRLLRGLCFLHESGFCHRDIKPDNIMIDKQWQPKFFDFASARPCNVHLTAGGVFTPEYAAPEVFDGLYYTASDIFSIGMVFLVMATKCGTYQVTDLTHEHYDKIAEGTLRPYMKGVFSPQVMALIVSLTRYQHDDRPCAEQALDMAESMEITYPIHRF
ncbi:MAG: serine/threonine-protein kinase, partial [Coxiellaceae bacterium]|nr:serine/threonine-protein kinase [Coxiellaceae bacterium]